MSFSQGSTTDADSQSYGGWWGWGDHPDTPQPWGGYYQGDGPEAPAYQPGNFFGGNVPSAPEVSPDIPYGDKRKEKSTEKPVSATVDEKKADHQGAV